MSNWYNGIYKGFIMASVIAFVIGFFSQGEVSLGAYISGYSVLILAIMMILIILINNMMRVLKSPSTFEMIFSIIMTTGPFLLMLGIIGFILYLMINYKNNIISGHLSPSYHSFSNITIILLLIQLYIVYTNIDTDKFETTGKLSPVVSSIIYLLGVLTGISSIILFTILNYFTTDGFRVLKI
jgi:preprotein translocase subunit Sss1